MKGGPGKVRGDLKQGVPPRQEHHYVREVDRHLIAVGRAQSLT